MQCILHLLAFHNSIDTEWTCTSFNKLYLQGVDSNSRDSEAQPSFSGHCSSSSTQHHMTATTVQFSCGKQSLQTHCPHRLATYAHTTTADLRTVLSLAHLGLSTYICHIHPCYLCISWVIPVNTCIRMYLPFEPEELGRWMFLAFRTSPCNFCPWSSKPKDTRISGG